MMHPGVVEWEAIVLAGGRGSRLGGVDKAALEFDGDTLLSRTLAAVAGTRRIVVVGDVDAPGVIVVQEQPRFSGPASAIGVGLSEVHAPYVLVVGCDQPFLAEAIGPVLEAASRGVDGAIAVDQQGRRQHLLSVLRTEPLRGLVQSRSTLTNLSVRALLAPLELLEVAVPARSTLDIDTARDLGRAQAENRVPATKGHRDV